MEICKNLLSVWYLLSCEAIQNVYLSVDLMGVIMLHVKTIYNLLPIGHGKLVASQEIVMENSWKSHGINYSMKSGRTLSHWI